MLLALSITSNVGTTADSMDTTDINTHEHLING